MGTVAVMVGDTVGGCWVGVDVRVDVGEVVAVGKVSALESVT
jgi:hypothetical protein